MSAVFSPKPTAVRSPARGSTGIGNPVAQGGPELITLSGATALTATASPYPTSDAFLPRQRLLVRAIGGDMWVTTDGSTPTANGSVGWKILANESQEFSGASVVYGIPDATTSATGGSARCPYLAC
jgi:hypothetical protein